MATAVLLPTVLALMVAAGPAAAAAKPDDPPPGLTPTTAKLQTVLDANAAAIGEQTHRSITDIETGTIDAYGVSGTYRSVYAGLHEDADYHRSVSLPPLSWQEGQYKGQSWRKNENGITTLLHPDYEEEGSDVKRLTADEQNPKNDVTLAGTVDDPFPAYVVQVKSPGDAPYWMFYDRATSLLRRVEIGYTHERHVVTLDDYRRENGQLEAWHTHETTIGNPANDWDQRILSDRYGEPIADTDLRIPPSNTGLVVFTGPSSVQLPTQFFDSFPVVHTSINGRGLDLVLDTDSSGMLLDRTVAHQLGLPTYGPHAQGSPDGDFAVIHDMTIGTLRMHDVVVTCSDLHFNISSEVKIVGEIGFDFLASTVVDIDYHNEAVVATQPSAFKPPQTQFTTSLDLDDGIPLIAAQFGPATGHKFLLDDLADDIELYSRFWNAGNGLTLDDTLLDRKSDDLKALWEPVEFRNVQIAGLVLGGVMTKLIADRSWDSRDDIDGYFGTSFLSMFHVYLDYPDQRAYFVPTARVEQQLNAGTGSHP